MIGARIPDGWPHFPAAYVSDDMRQLMSEIETEGSPWGPYLFLSRDRTRLIGSGGFKGEPRDGGVEVGYEIAPGLRERGYATEATEGLVEKAFTHPEVEFVLAHTLAERNPSTRVLEKAGFTLDGELNDPDDGPIWRWKLLGRKSD